ncbi:MAG TPA: hypothetical protein VM346_11495 [Sphingomicrobium sp.]|nr:hypothetical protein [Sphingomicrobium sp.]
MGKMLIGMIALWLLCGAVAGYLIENTRPMTMTDIALGPISLKAQL